MLIFLFITERLVDFVISLFAPRFFPYLGIFAHPKTLLGFDLPRFIYSFANFDGIYYLRIAKNGYQQYEQVFFPFYPILIRTFSYFTGNYLLAGLLISNLCAFFIFFMFSNYLKRVGVETQSIFYALILLLFFPTSFFLTSVYTEGLFLFLAILVFKALDEKKNFWQASPHFLPRQQELTAQS